jgi:hypothetical protein
MHIAAQVIHQHFSASLGQRQRMLLAQSTTCTCDNGDTSLKINAHFLPQSDSLAMLLNLKRHGNLLQNH